jgi:3-deoxy-D-manno-octulosonic-acid transferase
MGPHFANFRAITEDLLAHHALRIVDKAELASTLADLLHNWTKAAAMGARAKQVFSHHAGATARCVDALTELLSPRDNTEQNS